MRTSLSDKRMTHYLNNVHPFVQEEARGKDITGHTVPAHSNTQRTTGLI